MERRIDGFTQITQFFLDVWQNFCSEAVCYAELIKRKIERGQLGQDHNKSFIMQVALLGDGGLALITSEVNVSVECFSLTTLTSQRCACVIVCLPSLAPPFHYALYALSLPPPHLDLLTFFLFVLSTFYLSFPHFQSPFLLFLAAALAQVCVALNSTELVRVYLGGLPRELDWRGVEQAMGESCGLEGKEQVNKSLNGQLYNADIDLQREAKRLIAHLTDRVMAYIEGHSSSSKRLDYINSFSVMNMVTYKQAMLTLMHTAHENCFLKMRFLQTANPGCVTHTTS